MIIYNLLFVHSYLLALKSKSNREMPLFIPFMIIGICLTFNVESILLIIEGGLNVRLEAFTENDKYILCLLIVGAVFFYYLYKKKYKKILDEYKLRNANMPSIFYSIFIITLYFVTSVVILFISGLFRNGHWIFS